MIAQESAMLIEEIIKWLINNIPVLAVTGILSAAISILIGYSFQRRLATRAERRDHLEQIRSEVLRLMLERLEVYKSEVHGSVGGFLGAIPIEPTRPTDSRLYDTLPQHFPDLSSSYHSIEAEIRNFGQKCVSFQDDLKLALEANSGLTTRESHYTSKEPLITRGGLSSVYQSFFRNPTYRDKLQDYLSVRTIDRERDRFGCYLGDTSLAQGALVQMKKFRERFLSLVRDTNFAEKATALLQSSEQVLNAMEHVKDKVQDALAQSVLKGKCRYCPDQ